jgi:hypothetical protein
MNARTAVMSLLLAAAPVVVHALDREDADLAITQAGTAIQSAERADSAQYAAPDLATAHDMLNDAQAAYDHRHWTDSVFAAENAKADADLATAHSRQHRAEQATAEVERSVQTLREQLGLDEGDQP